MLNAVSPQCEITFDSTSNADGKGLRENQNNDLLVGSVFIFVGDGKPNGEPCAEHKWFGGNF
jgi:hypothetical protein